MDLDSATTPGALIALVRGSVAAVREHERDLMVLGVAWADAHPDLDPDLPANQRQDPAEDLDPDQPDPRVPAMAWDAGAPFAAALGVSTAAGEAMIADALGLRHRLPRVWQRLHDLEVPVWRARRIVQAVKGRPDDVCRHLDEAIAPVAEKVGQVTIDRLIDEAMMRLYPEERELAQLAALDARYAQLHEGSITETGIGEMTLRGDWKDLHDFSGTLSEFAAILAEQDEAAGRPADSLDVRRARAVGVLADPAMAAAMLAERPAPKPRRNTTLFLHLSADAVRGQNGTSVVGRCETPARPVLEQQIRDWCGRADTNLTVVPVIDLDQHASVERYEVSDRLAARVGLLHPTCVFPWCNRPARLCDKDHVIAYASGGTTCDCNLAPLCRRHHRLKTHARWRYRRLEPGVFIWRDPHGQRFLRDDRGTTDITADKGLVTPRAP